MQKQQEAGQGQTSAQKRIDMLGDVKFTDAKSFVKDQLSEQKVLLDVYKVGAERAKNEAVKEFARTALEDHQKSHQKLQEVASKHQVQAEETSQQEAQIRQVLERVPEEVFDKAFMGMAVSLHQREVQEFEAAAQKAQEQDVKQYAQGELSVIQQHLQQAKDTYQKVTGEAWTGGQQFTPTARYDNPMQQPGQEGAMGQTTTSAQQQGQPGLDNVNVEIQGQPVQSPSGQAPQSSQNQ